MPEDGSKYCVLLILTDGAITDLEATKEEIIKVMPWEIIFMKNERKFARHQLYPYQ